MIISTERQLSGMRDAWSRWSRVRMDSDGDQSALPGGWPVFSCRTSPAHQERSAEQI